MEIELKLNTCQRMIMYFILLSKCCIKLCAKVKMGEKSILEVNKCIEKGNKQLDEDFNVRNIIT